MSDPIRLTFPDGTSRTLPVGTTAGDALRQWAPERAATFLAALVDGLPVDLSRPLGTEGHLAPITFEDRAGREILQHSAAHLVAKAVVESVPDARPTVGPPTDDGFYYDFDVRPLIPADLDAIRGAIDATVRARAIFHRREVSREDAQKLFAANPYKMRYIADTPAGETISLYDTGTFVDLCRGPHVPDASWLEGVHILGFSAITSEKAAPDRTLQRIRGVGFPTKEALKEYLKLRSEAEARDHRTLGQKLELFTFFDESPGFPAILPNGIVVIRELERFVREHLDEAGYREVRTPLLFAQSVYETSGHWSLYRENMFLTTAEDRVFGWKPMNCPGSMLIFRSRARSYRELPLRLAEFAPIHRLEASGTLHGLTRVREFVQDDAHLFVTEDQIEAEVRKLLDWIARAFSTFRLRWSYELSKRPAQFLGEAAVWDRAEAILERILRDSGIDYKVSPGEGAFYGPKIDIHLRDSLGRPWQTGTIQLDYQMPLRFGLQYQGSDGQLHTPVVVHRTILGSFERFLGVLLEHTGGRLPPWLAPVQARILPVTERQTEAAEGLAAELRKDHIRVEVASTEESLSKRVRTAEVERVPYVIVLGEKEVTADSVALRIRGTKETRTLSRPELRDHLSQRIRSREFDP
ncbi:MAG: threonine--tRNA ligase [Thermoplasmata archaeon]|nr:threonine--tRNA ligase [Thermoplasmata archaeon]